MSSCASPNGAFQQTSDEILLSMLGHLLVRDEPIHIGYYPIKPMFPEVTSILQVSRRFHNIAKELIYQHNTFEIWDAEIWFDLFTTRLSPFARSHIKTLRLEWPLAGGIPRHRLLEWMARCPNIQRLELFCFSGHISVSALQLLNSLPLNNIWFEISSCQTPKTIAIRPTDNHFMNAPLLNSARSQIFPNILANDFLVYPIYNQSLYSSTSGGMQATSPSNSILNGRPIGNSGCGNSSGCRYRVSNVPGHHWLNPCMVHSLPNELPSDTAQNFTFVGANQFETSSQVAINTLGPNIQTDSQPRPLLLQSKVEEIL